MHPLGTSLFSIQIHVGAKFFEIWAPKDVKVSNPEVYACTETFLKIRAEKIWRLKNTGGGNHPLTPLPR